jgi:hypothetical protein
LRPPQHRSRVAQAGGRGWASGRIASWVLLLLCTVLCVVLDDSCLVYLSVCPYEGRVWLTAQEAKRIHCFLWRFNFLIWGLRASFAIDMCLVYAHAFAAGYASRSNT